MNSITFGLSVALIGILVVFIGLVILIGCIKMIALVAGDKKPKEKAAPALAKTETPAGAKAAAPAIAPGIPADVLAAITAAIAAVWQGDTGFAVRHVRRIHNAPAWNRAGREDQIYSRM